MSCLRNFRVPVSITPFNGVMRNGTGKLQRFYARQNVSSVVSVFFVIIIASYMAQTEGTTENECSRNCSVCSQGNCTECQPGFWGADCQECVDCWNNSCDNDTGRCEECSPGLYTENCNKTCPGNCRPGNDNVTHCNRETGECMRCEFGVEGRFCDVDSKFAEDELVTTFELNVVAQDKRAAEQDINNTVWGRLIFTLILVLIPFVVVAAVQLIPLLVNRLRQKAYSPKSKLDKHEETSIPLSGNYHKISQRNGDSVSQN